jgi:hypothetical protein
MTHLHVVPRSRMRGAIPPLPNTPSWRGAQLQRKAQGQLYFYLYHTPKNSNVEFKSKERTVFTKTSLTNGYKSQYRVLSKTEKITF